MKKLAIFLLLALPLFGFSQFTFQLKPIQLNGLPGLQSYAYGQYDSTIILIGGRLDGLHQRQPFASFAASGNNKQIFAIKPQNGTVLSVGLNELPTSIQEQLQSTNIQYFQHGDTLYLVGGYGYSAIVGNHITYPYLTTVDVAGLVKAMKGGKSILPYFKQVMHQDLAVTGGHLEMLNDTFILVGGNRFDGRYNPMGNPTYTQKYTNSVKRFSVDNTGSIPSINLYSSWYDSLELHRRDYNLTPAIFANEEQGFTAWSGVFRYDVDLPFLNSVDILKTGTAAQHVFEQKLNQYHTANLSIYDKDMQVLNTVFFGGIGQYYYNAQHVLVRNDSVPFVKTISKISRQSNGLMNETAMDIQMPGYLGASAEMVQHLYLPRYENRVIKWNELNGDSISLGYIVGGINSSQANIFWINNGTQSSASMQLFEVILVKDKLSGIEPTRTPGSKPHIYPNPSGDRLYLEGLPNCEAAVELINQKGEVLMQQVVNASSLSLSVGELPIGVYTLKIGSSAGVFYSKWIKM